MGARHHLVPQFYLRNFADESSQVALVDRDDYTRTVRTTVRKAVAEVGFYRIETEDLEREEDRATHDPEAVENGLAELEAAIAPVVDRVVTNRTFEYATEEEGQQAWYRLIQFTALQTVRGHRWREDLKALVSQAVRIDILSDDATLRAWLIKDGRPHGHDDIAVYRDDLLNEPFPQLVPPQAVLVQESLKMALGNPDTGDRGLGQFLAPKAMNLIRPTKVPVLTSDEPVLWWSPGDEPVGPATAAVVWFPLSRDLILQFRDPARDLRELGLPDLSTAQGHDHLAGHVNQLVAAAAERWVVHYPDDEPLAGIETPPREAWGDELVEVHEEEGTRREIYVHRRLKPGP